MTGDIVVFGAVSVVIACIELDVGVCVDMGMEFIVYKQVGRIRQML